jgi:hypothetical protein
MLQFIPCILYASPTTPSIIWSRENHSAHKSRTVFVNTRLLLISVKLQFISLFRLTHKMRSSWDSSVGIVNMISTEWLKNHGWLSVSSKRFSVFGWTLGPIYSSVFWEIIACLWEMSWESIADRLHPRNTEIRNEWSCISTSHMSNWCGF